MLDESFYSRALKELGQWGQDPEALAEVTKRLEGWSDGGRRVSLVRTNSNSMPQR